MEFKNIIYTVEDGIAIITMNRPKALNALNTETSSELMQAFAAADQDDAVKGIIITGSGKAFIAGADISQMKDLNVLEGRDMTILGQNLMNQIEKTTKVVIAAVNGFALGGGCELAMGCDFRIASETAQFGQPEVNLGIIPGYGGTQRLPRLIGKGNAKYYTYTAEFFSAQEAYRMGLVQKVVPADALLDETKKVMKTIMSKAPVAIKLAKVAINNGLNVDLETGVNFEAEAYTVTFACADRVEGMTAFVEKRKANFQGK